MIEPSNEIKRKNRVLAERAEKARRVLEIYGYGGKRQYLTALVDFLVDALHLAEADGVAFNAKNIMELALHLYRAEHPQALEGSTDDQTSGSGLEVRPEPSEEE
jgi:hypothetical protein